MRLIGRNISDCVSVQRPNYQRCYFVITHRFKCLFYNPVVCMSTAQSNSFLRRYVMLLAKRWFHNQDAQTTALGTVTPCWLQMLCAYSTEVSWSALLQLELRQQAKALRRPLFLQMQAALEEEQLPMLSPLVCLFTQACYIEGKPESVSSRDHSRRVNCSDQMNGLLTAQLGSFWAEMAAKRAEATRMNFMLTGIGVFGKFVVLKNVEVLRVD